MRKSELKKAYFEIYMKYKNNYITLEDIGNKYGISKQRVWQIIRYSKIGKGDYYAGLREYEQTKTKIKNTYPEASTKETNSLLREWLRINDIRLIKNG